MVEHVSAGEKENGNQAEGSPEVTVLKDRSDVGGRHDNEGDDAEDGGGDRHHLHIVDGSVDGGSGEVGGELAGNPGVDLFGGLWAVFCVNFVSTTWSCIWALTQP